MVAAQLGGAVVRCKKNTSGYRICEFFTVNRIKGNDY